MNRAPYTYRDQVVTQEKLWNISRHPANETKFSPYRTVANWIENKWMFGVGYDITDQIDEAVSIYSFHEKTRFVFVERKLSEFLDGMKIKDVPPDYIEPAIALLPDHYLLVWGDGGKCLCSAMTVEKRAQLKFEFYNNVNELLPPYNKIEVCDSGSHDGWVANVYITALETYNNIAGYKLYADNTIRLTSHRLNDYLHQDYNAIERRIGSEELSKDESATIRMAVVRLLKLLIYLASYPGQLKDGIVGDCALSSLQPKHIHKKSQTLTIKKEHHSICSHVRTSFFRLYPIRKDGTRNPGLVFVRSAIVNGKAQTTTAIEGE